MFEISSSLAALKKAVALFTIEGATAFLRFKPSVSFWFGIREWGWNTSPQEAHPYRISFH
ncbi:hypothetical protein BCT46_19855 [Vibrio sp. 10N.261.46.E8]|nr:hypothetical protein BH584_21100 [Vibrio sp. 10N.261.45.E1]PMJ35319.1 hypothetical protein BCU27_02400 [Vibrio sp. 10N.286.45.B6]PML83633.1 hypothetical protein BCT66_18595 [Vibrio sp. 10N.261.49.E11]PMM74795.1 hypothetical protein BCT48_03100 [Vibrio sp. 10N.261.46.F12]PMM79513.1 hypothetical protein BCT46_19855 [Vibrio sp. 10N.261.46.E8]PMN38011.1 hypothetical protein BCT34_04475 [Vibrio sp. 10N.261.45.E2]PMN53991.1 hypothetical protein BCT32_03580 [Vibrio sp. 10N.261.45.E11]PMN80337.1 